MRVYHYQHGMQLFALILEFIESEDGMSRVSQITHQLVKDYSTEYPLPDPTPNPRRN